MISLSGLLEMYGLDLSKKVKIVRHKDGRGSDVHMLHSIGQLTVYQSYQENDVFSECDYIVSFLGLENTKAQLVGVYKVKGTQAAHEVPLPNNFYYQGRFKENSRYYYDLEEVPGFEALNERVIIEWGSSAISWHQWLHKRDREVVQILPVGYVKEFPGYLDFVLSHEELKRIIENPDANQVWHTMLSGVAGIYLIADNQTGLQYVGSAYGKAGILGRWKEYSKNGHGDNSMLKALLEEDSSYVKNFQFTILQTLLKSLPFNQVVAHESKYKVKLGTRSHGLNIN